jgi:hypothetical protein
MKRQILISLILIGYIMAINAQIYTPNGMIQGPSDNNNIGIGTLSPKSKLHSVSGVNALPVTSGTTQSGSALRLEGANNAIIDFGIYNSSAWIQSTDKLALGYKYSLLLNPNGGNVGIGTTCPQTALDIVGTIRADEVKVDLTRGQGCDFVFKRDYNLMDLNKLEEFVKTNQHLPEIASEKEMVDNGVNMKELQMKLLQKIEELTLYTIEQNEKIQALEEKILKIETALK